MKTWQWMIKPMTISCRFWGAIIGGLISVAGSLWSSKKSQDSADKQMNFQEELSNSAYQRTMADMKKAGLNPILASKVGGASTPTGASVVYQNPTGQAVSSAMDVERSMSTAALTRANTVITEKNIPMAEMQNDLTREIKTMFDDGKAMYDSGLDTNKLTTNVAEFLNKAESIGGDAYKATTNAISKVINDAGSWGQTFWKKILKKGEALDVGIK